MKRLIVIFALMLFSISAHAFFDIPENLKKDIESMYRPATPHRGLDSAYEELDLSKINTYVVLKQGGIPAEKASWYITWSDYDYRPVRIKDDKVKTRSGSVFAYLKAGDVLAVSYVEYASKFVYLKLITPQIYKPSVAKEKKYSRVTAMLGFQFPKNVISNADSKTILKKLNEWVEPFNTKKEAEEYARRFRVGDVQKYTPRYESDSDLTDLPPDNKVPGIWKTKEDDGAVTLRVGMTKKEVENVLGAAPQKAVLKDKELYRYPDKVVEFRNGRVFDIIFITR
ncbi:hypothetical protein KKA47_02405 [bacterium]|nr:hypothetical protein [bacterium]